MRTLRDDLPEIDRLIEAGDFAGALRLLKVAGVRDGIYKPKGEIRDADELFAGLSDPPTREELERIERIIFGPGGAASVADA